MVASVKMSVVNFQPLGVRPNVIYKNQPPIVSKTFPIVDILKLAKTSQPAAVDLFKNSIKFAVRFDVYDIAQMAEEGMKAEAEILFDKTVESVSTIFLTSNIEKLATSGLPEKAIQLFKRTVQYAKEFNTSDIQRLLDCGLLDQAITLFDETVQFTSAHANFSAYDIVLLANEGLKQQAKILFDKTIRFAKAFSVNEIENIAAAGLKKQAEKLFNQTVVDHVPKGTVGRLSKVGLTKAMLTLFDKHAMFLPSLNKGLDTSSPPFVPKSFTQIKTRDESKLDKPTQENK